MSLHYFSSCHFWGRLLEVVGGDSCMFLVAPSQKIAILQKYIATPPPNSNGVPLMFETQSLLELHTRSAANSARLPSDA